MSAARTAGTLLRLYPPGWRARYGDELAALIVETSGGGVPWRVRLDVALGAGRERLRSAGLAGDPPPAERMRGGTLLVLCAWALFAVAGVGVQKFSEHWQSATPGDSRALPEGAFGALLVGAGVGSALVLAGAAAVLPAVVRFLRAGGWRAVRRHVLVAAGLTLAAAAASVGVVLWAHRLSAFDRSGRDPVYATVAGIWSLLLACCLAAWTVAGVALARRVALSTALLRVEALLAACVALAMVGMTVATAVWWAALARSAPWFLAGRPAGAAGSAVPPVLLAAMILMLVAAATAASGAAQAVRAAGRGRDA